MSALKSESNAFVMAIRAGTKATRPIRVVRYAAAELLSLGLFLVGIAFALRWADSASAPRSDLLIGLALCYAVQFRPLRPREGWQFNDFERSVGILLCAVFTPLVFHKFAPVELAPFGLLAASALGAYSGWAFSRWRGDVVITVTTYTVTPKAAQ